MKQVALSAIIVAAVACGSCAVWAHDTGSMPMPDSGGAMPHQPMPHDTMKHEGMQNGNMPGNGRHTGMDAVPPGLNMSTERESAGALYHVKLEDENASAALGQMHSYILTVSTRAGAPVDNATISIDGGMPQHGHGLPTAPQVTKNLGDGKYLIEGVQFSMAGWWQLTFDIFGSEGADRATFNMIEK